MSERRVVDDELYEALGSAGSLDNILLATDGSKSSEAAAATTAKIAGQFGSRLHLVHVTPVHSFYSCYGEGESDTLSIFEEDDERARSLLERQAEKLRSEGVNVEQTHLRIGEPDAEVVALAEEIGADLVVAGSHGTGAMKRATIGRVSESIVRHAHCPVLVVRQKESTSDEREA